MAKYHLAKRGQSEGAHLAVDFKVKSSVSSEPLTVVCVHITASTPLASSCCPTAAQPKRAEILLFQARLQGLVGGNHTNFNDHRFSSSFVGFTEIFQITDPNLGAPTCLTLPNPLQNLT